MTTPSRKPDLPMTILVDTEHIGVRFLIPSLAIIGILVGIALSGVIQAILGDLVSVWCVAMILAVILAIALTQIGERFIKPLWPSGRYLTLAQDGLALHHRKTSQQHRDYYFRWAAEPKIYSWYWSLDKRKSRVQQGWHCVAVRLSEGEHAITIYSFMSPIDAEALPRFNEWFVHLLPKVVRERMTESDPRQAAIQARYKEFENERWIEGAEIDADDFAILIKVISESGHVSIQN